MDPIAFSNLKRRVRQTNREDDKVKAIAAKARAQFSAEQVGELLSEFSSDDGRLKGLGECREMLPATCEEILPILRTFSSDNKKLEALRLIALQISDRGNSRVVEGVITDEAGRQQVRDFLNQIKVPPVMPRPTDSSLSDDLHQSGT